MPPNTRRPGPLNGSLQGDPFDLDEGDANAPLGVRAPVAAEPGSGHSDSFLNRFGGDDVLIPALPDISLGSLQLDSAIVAAAGKEWDRWNSPVKLTERMVDARKIVKTYWKVGVDLDFTDQEIKDKTWEDDHPWSAAFISYIMRVAGAGDRFAYAIAHWVYIRWAIKNRLEKRDFPFKAYRLNEVVPEPGDLVGMARSGSGADYDNIQKNSYKTHCDIVTEVNKGEIVTIGGNVGDSVSKTKVPLDKTGHIAKAHYFVIIKVEGLVPFDITTGGDTRIA